MLKRRIDLINGMLNVSSLQLHDHTADARTGHHKIRGSLIFYQTSINANPMIGSFLKVLKNSAPCALSDFYIRILCDVATVCASHEEYSTESIFENS